MYRSGSGHKIPVATKTCHEMEGRFRGRLRFPPKSPPIISTSLEEIESPKPVPPNLRVVDPSACEKASKMTFCFFLRNPIPVSRTEKWSQEELGSVTINSR